MPIVSNDPTWWSTVNAYRVSSYFIVAASVGLMYDWALTLGQEVELVWRQRWSLMTVLYLGVRYLGIIFVALVMLGFILYVVWNWMRVVVFAMLWVIIITRLHAMYQRSRKILIFLIVTFLADNIFNGVAAVLSTMHTSGEELILSGTYQCSIALRKMYHTSEFHYLDTQAPVWEVIILCLAIWIAVKHFRELRRHSAGGIIGDCFAVLIQTHMLYFASFVAVSCFTLVIDFFPTIPTEPSSLAIICYGLVQNLEIVQMFVLGPRLILSVREYHAKLVADSDAETSMTSIAFQERVHISTGNSV
ncbi:hypothetical protein DFJ58DRAFT_727519 [Suillus subalutaceus]|uniref:uncharacterized protein n=1 Tax=Suillus subalutaceus TaxID=48586 RepID=UPI001B85D0B1|nr:uncharacterized protein DFJ58DRAFT_727519 [Suillus subalutaceus]KAG1855324.1 hypothetical protein DFJ58DRAFT_727519 [Suillus subalutaceus]